MVYLVLFLVLYFFLLSYLSIQFVGTGSDHYFHKFYIEIVKKNGNKFFSRFENFIDETYTTDPLLSYKMFSYLPSNQVLVLAKYLNPILMTFLLILFTFIVFNLNFLSEFDFFLLLILIGFNPQYFYAQNARLYGLSSRGLGLLLGTGILISLYFTTYIDIIFIILTIYLIYLSWITNLFLQQFLVVISILMMIVFGEYLLFVSLVLSLIIFFTLNYNVAISFFINRWAYFKIYKNILAERFILKYRYSIWRDWIYDFWIKTKYTSFPNWLSYVYSNSILIVLFINPIIIVILIQNFSNLNEFHTSNTFVKFCYYLSVSSVFAFIITSFRSTRFLGEPERYIEMVIPFFTVLIFYNKKEALIEYLPFIFILICVFQIFIFLKMKNKLYPKDNIETINEIVRVIKLKGKGKEIRVTSNDMDILKKLLNTDWKFLYYYPTNEHLGGIDFEKVFIKYPLINEEYLSKLVNDNRINFLILSSPNGIENDFSNGLVIYNDLFNKVIYLG